MRLFFSLPSFWSPWALPYYCWTFLRINLLPMNWTKWKPTWFPQPMTWKSNTPSCRMWRTRFVPPIPTGRGCWMGMCTGKLSCWKIFLDTQIIRLWLAGTFWCTRIIPNSILRREKPPIFHTILQQCWALMRLLRRACSRSLTPLETSASCPSKTSFYFCFPYALQMLHRMFRMRCSASSFRLLNWWIVCCPWRRNCRTTACWSCREPHYGKMT